MDSLVRINRSLTESLNNSEEMLVQFNEKSKKMEQSWSRYTQKKERKIVELEAML